MANRLYIIGNGFDIHHGLETNYKYYREYIEANMDSFKTDDNYSSFGFREHTSDINSIYKKDAEYILEAMDSCASDDWAELETQLGKDLFEKYIFNKLYSPKMPIESAAADFVSWGNNIVSGSIATMLYNLNDLFYLWVDDRLKNGIDYSNKRDNEIGSMLDPDDLYLVLNYTLTLEEIYNIPSENICHIHGIVGQKYDDIYFGHGNAEEIEYTKDSSTNTILNEMKKLFRKDTEEAYGKHKEFFNRLNDIKEIYSYGFSFSDTDMFYVEKIIERVNAEHVTWYFNGFDQKHNAGKKDVLKKYRFSVGDTDKW